MTPSELQTATIDAQIALLYAQEMTSIASNMIRPTAKAVTNSKSAWVAYNKAYQFLMWAQLNVDSEDKL